MLYVAIIPGWVWAVVLIGLWLALVHRVLVKHKLKSTLVQAFVTLTSIQLAAACSVVIATMIYRIGSFACFMGIFGLWGTMAAAMIEAALLGVLYQRWPGDTTAHKRFMPFAFTWFFFALTAILIHGRSAALCTV